MLKKFRKAIIENDELISAALKADLNKQPFESYMCETGLLLDEINFHIKRLKKWSKTRRVKSGIGQLPGKSYVCPEPYGVVLIMAPWNYPVQLCLMPLVGAISAGNCGLRAREQPRHLKAYRVRIPDGLRHRRRGRARCEQGAAR